MKVILISSAVVIGLFSQDALAEPEKIKPMIEASCHNETILVFPDVIDAPNGKIVKFISTFGGISPYVRVSYKFEAYEPDPIVNVSYSEYDGKYFGTFNVVSNSIEFITIDGCKITWENK